MLDMQIKFRRYNSKKMFSSDFIKVRDFLMETNREELHFYHFTWERWEWIFSLPYMNQEKLNTIGLWEEDNKLVALVTYEEWAGGAYFIIKPGYEFLTAEMIEYAEKNLSYENKLWVCVLNTDVPMQKLMQSRGYFPGQKREPNSIFDISAERLQYTIPEGFQVISFADEFEWKKYNRVLWNGFNHDGDPPETDEQQKIREISLSGPHNDLSLKIAIVAPDGNYASYCGMWYEEETSCCFVEPVATDPTYRRKGCGRAAVLEGIKRCADRGAKEAYVGSDQIFYYRIGFRPLPAYTFWEKEVKSL
jgi:GNAT superfamily N-acetyltransferase